MRALLQRVSRAAVAIGDRQIAAIDGGLLVLVGIFRDDDEAAARRLAERTLAARVFDHDDHGGHGEAPGHQRAMNYSVLDVGGGVLVVSQFTLAADTSRGNRPSFAGAAPRALARPLYECYVRALRAGGGEVSVGEFGANMRVSSINDGPVTILLEAP